MSENEAEAAKSTSIEELANACVTYVHRVVGIELDFTPETLPILDHYLSTLRGGEAREEIESLVVASAGAYFGEVVRRGLGRSRWHIEENDPQGWRLEMEHIFLFFNPLGMAREAIAGAEQAGWFAHLEVLPRDRGLLDQSLARMGEIREDDYYRLAVRHEVIEQVVVALENASISRDAQTELFAPATFGPAVYAATARALRGDPPESLEQNS